MVLTGSDAIIQNNIRSKRVILIQEGMTEPEGLSFHTVRALKLPRWMANTSVTGLSNAYDAFCVASHGYKDLFVKKGVRPEKMIISGIPNFDNFSQITNTGFPHTNHVLAATTPYRETLRFENRPHFIKHCLEIAVGRLLIFKLHPLENTIRAKREINQHASNALVYWRGNIEEMMLNASAVITQLSSCTLAALVLGKEVQSNLETEELMKLMPMQNGGASAVNIANVCRSVLSTPMPVIKQRRSKLKLKTFWDRI